MRNDVVRECAMSTAQLNIKTNSFLLFILFKGVHCLLQCLHTTAIFFIVAHTHDEQKNYIDEIDDDDDMICSRW